MTAPAWWFWGLLVVVVIGLYLSQMAGRLDRLHVRVDQARQALDAQLLRRSAVAVELAASGMLDPASSLVVADSATSARAAEGEERWQAEDALTTALNAALPDAETVVAIAAQPGGDDLVGELAAATRRVVLAQAFLDDAVRSCAAVRSKRVVRVFRLAGRAPWPRGIDVDVTEPDGLAMVGASN